MRTQAISVGCALLLIVTATPVSAAPDPSRPSPSPEMAIAKVWSNLDLQSFELQGAIRIGQKRHPLRLVTKGREMIYKLSAPPGQLRVRFLPEKAELSARVNETASWRPLSAKERVQPLLETDITPIELSLEFLYWPDVAQLGTDAIKTLPAFAYEATAPSSSLAPYAKVRFWVSSDHFVILRADGINAQGQAIKRIEVNSVRKVQDAYVIGQMQISSMIPGRDLSKSRTFIEIETGESSKP